jgi:hypothetical protein
MRCGVGAQLALHDTFIPAVMEPLNESQLPRLQCIAANALFNFIGEVSGYYIMNCRRRCMQKQL